MVRYYLQPDGMVRYVSLTDGQRHVRVITPARAARMLAANSH